VNVCVKLYVKVEEKTSPAVAAEQPASATVWTKINIVDDKPDGELSSLADPETW